MRLAKLHSGIVALLAFNGALVSAVSQEHLPPLQFDFGPGPAPPGFAAVSPGTPYSSERSYGLLSDSLTAVNAPDLAKALGQSVADGLEKDGPILFRVDLPKGTYVIELLMSGGRHATWSGEITLNGTLIDTSLESFGHSSEGEYAPPFWGVLRKCTTGVDHIILRVRARGDRTTVNRLCVYPFREGTLRFADGRFQRTAAAVAPNFDLALKLINRGEIAEAARIIDAIPTDWPLDRADLLFALASRPETQTPRQVVESASAILSAEFIRTQDPALRLPLRLAELYAAADRQYRQAGWQWARDLNGMGIFGNCEIAAMSASMIASLPEHPLWPASVWHLARTCYWLWVEQHVDGIRVKADSLLRRYAAIYPGQHLTSVYRAEPEEPAAAGPDLPEAPRWALLQHAAVNRLKGIIHYWCEKRQAADGEFGGKYDDDVEMLRWWPFARIGIDDSLTLAGMKRLADGIWNSSWIANGWCAKVRDVEHSSEPVADTQPMMIGFDYGNPVYVERCMQSVRLALDLWTGRNGKGHRHFRSSWYSSTRVDSTPPRDCDVPYNTRTVKAIRWFAWYTRHPEALRFLREWADAWLEDCLRTDRGKPAGIVPAAIRFSDDAVGGHGDNWYHPGMFWDYYNYRGGTDMLAEFLSCYQLFGDARYLKPIEMSLELVERYPPSRGNADPAGTPAWAAGILGKSEGFWEVVEIWRFTTGNPKYDPLILRYGSPYLKYRLARDRKAMEGTLRDLLDIVDRTYPLITTEGYFTDRIEIRDQRGRDHNGASLLESMYLGSPLVSLFYPFNPVAWKNTDSAISALVDEASATSLRIRVFNHAETTKPGMATFSRLGPGEYEIVQGTDTNGDGEIEQVKKRETRRMTPRDSFCSFVFAPRTEELIVIRQKSTLDDGESAACDIALAASEVSVSIAPGGDAVVKIPVHNIGTADATDVVVELSAAQGTPADTYSVTIGRIGAPFDLVPKTQTASFTIPNRCGLYRIRAGGRTGVREITEVNNAIEFSLQ